MNRRRGSGQFPSRKTSADPRETAEFAKYAEAGPGSYVPLRVLSRVGYWGSRPARGEGGQRIPATAMSGQNPAYGQILTQSV